MAESVRIPFFGEHVFDDDDDAVHETDVWDVGCELFDDIFDVGFQKIVVR